jgi:electron transfer flavoprotein alpha subunit
MAEVLVLVEHAEGALKKVSAELITAARVLGEPAAVVVGGPGTAAPLVDGLKAAGAAKIYVAESDTADNYLITPAVDVLAALAESATPAGVLLAATADGKEIAGRLAARIGSGLLVDVVELQAGAQAGFKAVHSIFGGAFTVQAQASGDTPVITVRAGAIDAEPADGAGEQVTVDVPEPAENAAKITAREPAVAGDRPELTEATVVVSGGRGVGSAENFSVVEQLADSLGAAVGASRAAVDSGYYPGQFQVGQTGKTVSPQLYIALGISGAIQHRAGMQTSKTIIAVNKDEEAPIFEIADYGVIGDLFKVAPQLTEAVKARKG